MGTVQPLLTKRFFDYVEKELLKLAKGELLHRAYAHDAETHLLQPTTTEAKGYGIVADNIKDIPVDQAAWVAFHDNLTDNLNQRLLGLAYLLKISNLMPKIINEFGPEYSYSISTQTNRMQSSSIDLVYFANPHNIIEEMNHSIAFTFHYLHGIRVQFSPNTLQELENDPTRDSFTAQFLNGRLLEANDMGSRIEVMFFQKFGIPLGIFDAHDHIRKWLEKSVIRHGVGNGLYRFIAKKELTTPFPGLIFCDVHGQNLISSKIKSDFSLFVYGIIPKQGITFGEYSQKPEPSAPRLVR